MKLSEITSGHRTVTARWNTATVTVTYRIAERTPESQKRDTSDDPWLARALVGWDITDDDDEVLPVTIESLERVPRPILDAILVAIFKDDGDLPEAASSSDAG